MKKNMFVCFFVHSAAAAGLYEFKCSVYHSFKRQETKTFAHSMGDVFSFDRAF